MMYSSFGKRVNVALVDAIHRPRNGHAGDKAILRGSGHGGDPLNDQRGPELASVVSRGYTVLHGTWSGSAHWGRDSAQTEVLAGRTLIQAAPWSAAAGPVGWLGASMGGLLGLLLVLNNPTLFSAIAVGIPAVSPIDIHDRNVAGYAADIEAAYTNLAGWNAAKATHDPLARAAEYAALGIGPRLGIWYSNNDPITPKELSEAFIAATGAIGVNMGDQTTGPIGYEGHAVYTGFAAEAASFLSTYA